jgi:hypothetical protein
VTGSQVITGNVGALTVRAGASADVQGNVQGPVTVERGGRLVVSNGVISGNITSHGGNLVLGGVTNGNVNATGGSIQITGIVNGVVTASRDTKISQAAGGIAQIRQQ